MIDGWMDRYYLPHDLISSAGMYSDNDNIAVGWVNVFYSFLLISINSLTLANFSHYQLVA